MDVHLPAAPVPTPICDEARGSRLATTTDMTTIATPPKDPPSETKSGALLELPSARTPPPQLATPRADSESELESRVMARRAQLIGRLGELRAEAGLEVVEASDRLKAKLSELAHIIAESVVDGWANLGDNAKHRLERWISESERALPTPEPTGKTGRA
jgi:hypothetical protein